MDPEKPGPQDDEAGEERPEVARPRSPDDPAPEGVAELDIRTGRTLREEHVDPMPPSGVNSLQS